MPGRYPPGAIVHHNCYRASAAALPFRGEEGAQRSARWAPPEDAPLADTHLRHVAAGGVRQREDRKGERVVDNGVLWRRPLLEISHAEMIVGRPR